MTTTYRRTFEDDSDDEIVWSLSDRREPSLLTPSPSYSLISDFSADFLILSHPLSPAFRAELPRLQQHTPITATFNVPLTEQVAKLRISGNVRSSAKKQTNKIKSTVLQNAENQPVSTKKPKKARKEKRKPSITTAPYPSPLPSPKARKTAAPAPAKAKAKKDQDGNRSNSTKPTTRSNPRNNSHLRPVVSTGSQVAAKPSLYEEASTYISRFLSNPEAKNDSVCRLTLLQSLIIELGLATSNLPASLKSARAFLKARAFLNIREYIAVRSQGPEAIRRVMYPNKSALMKDFKKHRGSRAPLHWVKDMGLQVLLVGWMH